jgi:excisionase family DNA binding protein
MPVLEVKTLEPAALSPDGAAKYLSISRRRISILIADGILIARKDGARTLVDLASVKAYYDSLPRAVSVSIPNSPQALRSGTGDAVSRPLLPG